VFLRNCNTEKHQTRCIRPGADPEILAGWVSGVGAFGRQRQWAPRVWGRSPRKL